MMDNQNHIKKAVFNIFDFIVSVFYWFSFVLMLILSGALAGYLHCLFQFIPEFLASGLIPFGG